jgi:hypothetical protein
MDFAYTERINTLRQRLNDFMEQHIYPNEATYDVGPRAYDAYRRWSRRSA